MQSVEVNRTGVADTAETALWPLLRPPGYCRTARGNLLPCVLAGAILRLAPSMELAPTGGGLVPLVGLPMGAEPGLPRAVLAAVALSAVMIVLQNRG